MGARPDIIQAAPVAAALTPFADELLVHTGQHYDAQMSGDQFDALRLRQPDFNLDVGSRPDQEQLELATARLRELIARTRPDAVLVRGDTNGTLSGARAANAAGVPLLHIESGLRSYRPGMPEERNRVETDRRSDVLFAPTTHAAATLAGEGVRGLVHVTGDPLCDLLESVRPSIRRREGTYLLATIHRDYNTDQPDRLAAVLDCLSRSPWPVIWPLHPRTRRALDTWSLSLPPQVQPVDPVPYTRMLELERNAQAIATDSGGVQREAYLWGVRCITLREETEWVETVAAGWNTLVGVDPDAFAAALARPLPADRPVLFGDGRASQRIARLTAAFLGIDVEEAA